MEELKVVIVGFGNMGKALVSGWINDGMTKENIHAVDVTKDAQQEANKLGVDFHFSSASLPENVDVVLLAVKPQVMAAIASDYARFVNTNTLFISIAAGITIASLTKALGVSANIVRVMPNTPASIGKGMSVLCASPKITYTDRICAEKLISAVGEVAWADDEKHMDIVTAISGSGPAYFFLLVEELVRAGKAQGLPSELAEKLAVNTAWGAGALVKENLGKTSPTKLREAVTSPGGTTQAGLEVFFRYNFSDIVGDVVGAATRRSREL